MMNNDDDDDDDDTKSLNLSGHTARANRSMPIRVTIQNPHLKNPTE